VNQISFEIGAQTEFAPGFHFLAEVIELLTHTVVGKFPEY